MKHATSPKMLIRNSIMLVAHCDVNRKGRKARTKDRYPQR